MGSSISTIVKSSSDYGALNYMDAVKVSLTGDMYEKEKLGIVNDKSRIHKETIANGKVKQGQHAHQLHQKPMYDTTLLTKNMLNKIDQMFKEALAKQQNIQQLVPAKSESMSDVDFIPLLVPASCASTSEQTVKKPISKKKKEKDINRDDEYFIDENKETDLLMYWEFQKEFSQNH